MMKAPFFNPGTTTMQWALSSRSCGMDRSGVDMISWTTAVASSRRGCVLSAPKRLTAVRSSRMMYGTVGSLLREHCTMLRRSDALLFARVGRAVGGRLARRAPREFGQQRRGLRRRLLPFDD